MESPLRRLRRRLLASVDDFEDAVDRRRVGDFIADLRRLCESEGPWRFAALVDAPEDADPRQIAYLLAWREGPGTEVWSLIERFDAVDLVIDAALEGFDAFLAVHPRV